MISFEYLLVFFLVYLLYIIMPVRAIIEDVNSSGEQDLSVTSEDKESSRNISRSASKESLVYEDYAYEEYGYHHPGDISREEMRSYHLTNYSVGDCTKFPDTELPNKVDHLYAEGYRLNSDSDVPKVLSIRDVEKIKKEIKDCNILEEEELVIKISQKNEWRVSSYDFSDERGLFKESHIENCPDVVFSEEPFYGNIPQKLNTKCKYAEYVSKRMFLSEKGEDKKLRNKIHIPEYKSKSMPSIKVPHEGPIDKFESIYINRFMDQTENRRKCFEDITKLSEEIEGIREYEQRRAIKIDEKENIFSDANYEHCPIFSLDLHGFKYDSGIYSVEKFLDVMIKYSVSKFSIIYGYSGHTMESITKEYAESLKQKSEVELDYVNFGETEAEFELESPKDWIEYKKGRVDDKYYVFMYPNFRLFSVEIKCYNGKGLIKNTEGQSAVTALNRIPTASVYSNRYQAL